MSKIMIKNRRSKYKIIALSLGCILCMGFITGCAKKTITNKYVTEEGTLKEIEEVINNLSLEEKIGQMFIVGFNGSGVTEELINLITNTHVGGFILFNENIRNVGQVTQLINDIKNENRKSNIPLFISVDEEGGNVSRLPNEFLNTPTSAEMGDKNSEDLSNELGGILGESIKGLGFNMDFAPVLDVTNSNFNEITGNRSFGEDAELVSNLGISTMKGIMDEGVIPVVKHFPGLGGSDKDTHYEIAQVKKSIEELEKSDLIPFQRAIDEGVEVVMTGHILLSQVDSEYPASMSSKVIEELLRQDMGFEGLVITDDMDMGAIGGNYSIAEAAVQAIKAGVDLILISRDYENQQEAINAVKEAVEMGVISEERIDESLYRILRVKSKYRINDNNNVKIDVDNLNGRIDRLWNKLRE